MDRSPIGDRMKNNYENRYRYSLPRRTNTIIRLDGKCFHSLTKNIQKPFDSNFMQCMISAAMVLCKTLSGFKFAYIQSDEISILLTDYDSINTEAWFDGNVSKILSISAATVSVAFSDLYKQPALFDSRCFVIPDIEEVRNYFIWRQQDASRNSINMAAQSVYTQKQLDGKNVNEVHDMLMAKGINWNDYTVFEKRGMSIKRVEGELQFVEPPIFTTDRAFIDINLSP